MQKKVAYFFLLAFLYNYPSEHQQDAAGQIANLARPSDVQYRWHEQERIMFVCLDPATWQGREYDDHSTPLERINPEKLDTDQWCETAQSWGAQEILFVAKHTGASAGGKLRPRIHPLRSSLVLGPGKRKKTQITGPPDGLLRSIGWLRKRIPIEFHARNINRTAMVTEESRSILYLTVAGAGVCDGKMTFKTALIY